MGVFFYTKSVALIEDVPLEEEYESEAKLITDMETGFQQVSQLCNQITRYLISSYKGTIIFEFGNCCQFK